MKTFKYPAKKDWKELVQRPASNDYATRDTVKKILDKIRMKGDKALLQYTKKLDGVKLREFAVSEYEIREAAAHVPQELKNAIAIARQNILRFHKIQKQHALRIETMPGVVCWRKRTAIEKVGLYIPGGSAPLFSTVLMLAIPATIAGCNDIILCTPPGKDGRIHPAILYTASLCGITKIFKAGGAQAIAAMAYGTESIPAVYKIFGPGNSYVTSAKMLVQLDGISIDMPAGPSELLIIADETADPAFIAADLLSQAEHGPDSQVILVTNSTELAKQVRSNTRQQLSSLNRKRIAAKALDHSRIIVVKNTADAIELSNLYAPEHLIIMTADAVSVADKVSSAGSVFIGQWSPESAGDYASGTNHTLPTNGYAAMYSGVSVDSFMKTTSYQQISKEGLEKLGPTIMTLAAAENLDAHKEAVAIRLNKK
jgi:histidinol dehydrogenase